MCYVFHAISLHILLLLLSQDYLSGNQLRILAAYVHGMNISQLHIQIVLCSVVLVQPGMVGNECLLLHIQC